MAGSEDQSSQDGCPVDHKGRTAWLENARKQSAAASQSSPPSSTVLGGDSCDSSTIDQSQPTGSSGPSLPIPRFVRSKSLATDRETSTIPRVSSPAATTTSEPQHKDEPKRLANNEQETGVSASGNWIYPSEQMFFNAMKRKNYDPKSDDMRTIVPIHNAVNERAWREIKGWERGRGSEKCGGPRLHSFSGTATAMTPKARWNTLVGYHPPFDRHDWVVDRCGTRVDYVIDFYAGKDEGTGKSLNFYLDVRPKLNTFEGWKMRAGKMIGLS